MSTKTYWVYYENDKEEKFSQDDLEKMFASNQGLAEQKKEGTTFETWLSEMEKMQILNRHCCEISLNKIADMKDQMDSWDKVTHGYAAMMLDRSNGDMWVDYFPEANSFKDYHSPSIIEVPITGIIEEATEDHPLTKEEVNDAIFEWCDKKKKKCILPDETVEIIENEGWRVVGYESEEEVCIGKYSPAGEDFFIYVPIQNFAEKVEEYAQDFDVDEHVEKWIDARKRGVSGVPSTIRELLEDAEAIQKMLNDLAEALNKDE